jgi:PQQ-dependent dehydrogenase (methanol/ethanol family)
MSKERNDLVSDPIGVHAEDRVDHLETGPVSDTIEVDLIQEAPGEDVTNDLIVQDVNRPDSWLVNNKGLRQTGFSPSYQITPDNASKLSSAWSFKTDTGGLEVTPIIVPGDPPVMYVSTTNQAVHALNARTGENYWSTKYDADPGASRGVAVWKRAVYFGASNMDLVALDRYTGEVIWTSSFFADAQVNEEPMDEWRDVALSHTAAPVVYNGKVFLGQAGDSGGWAHAVALDANSGDVAWEQTMAPRDEWVGETWRFASNAPWMPPTIDPESDTVFYSVGNPDPQHGVTDRPGPNKYSNSIVAFDVDSGERKWENQILPHEIWDYDNCTTASVYDMEVAGEQRRVVHIDNKAGWSYVIDAETGQLVERSQPWKGVKQDHWGEGYFQLMPFADVPQSESQKARDQGIVEVYWPAASGASEWPADVFSPRTGLRYIGTTSGATTVYHNPSWEYEPSRDSEMTLRAGDHTYIPSTDLKKYSDGMYAGEKFTTSVTAVDPATGENKWLYEITDTFPDKSAFSVWPSGVTATAGNVAFVGAPGGSLIALNAETGDQVWMDDTGSRITGAPAVWNDPIAGTDFVAAANSDTIVAYSL